MISDKLARLRAYRNNIHRYRRLLGTQLTELERRFIEGRLAEETQAFRRLSDETFPVSLNHQSQEPDIDPLVSALGYICGELRPPEGPPPETPRQQHAVTAGA
jgi:hypothetical protein